MSSSGSFLKSSGGLAAATFSSRLLGFFREVLTARIVGGGTLMTAWSLAFMLPNLFRRILGEGALGTALVPLISHTVELEGKEAARRKFSTILIWLTLLLCAITLLVSIPAMVAAPFIETERVRLTLKLTPVVMPYCIFICLIGVMTSALNSLRVFFLPALGSLFLNVCLVAALLFVCPGLKDSPMALLDSLGVAVLVSGVLELALMLWLLRMEGMLPQLGKAALADWDAVREIWRLTLPGLLGASALQISMVADRSIACCVSEYAVPALNYSDRLIYLPIGVFAVSFGTVSLSEMSRSAAVSDFKTMLSHMVFSMRHLLFITVPMAAFMAIFGVPLLRLVYFGGEFGQRELQETALAFQFYACGVPAFAAIKVVVAGFYARKDMRTPVKVSVLCIVLNVILNLILMWPMRQGGIALATVVTSYLNNILLLCLLEKAVGGVPFKPMLSALFKLLLSSAVALAPAFWAFNWTLSHFGTFLRQDLLPLASASIVFGLVFLGLCALLGVEEAKPFVLRFVKLKR